VRSLNSCFLFALALLSLGIFLPSHTVRASTTVTSDITANTTWPLSGSPYIVQHDITVVAGATLTIEPGVIVKLNFTGNSSIEAGIFVYGAIKAEGTSADKIYFTSLEDDSIGGDTNGNGSVAIQTWSANYGRGYWFGIDISSPAAQSFKNIVFKYSSAGIRFSNNSSGTVDGMEANFNLHDLVLGSGSSVSVANMISDASEASLTVNAAHLTLTDSEIKNSPVSNTSGLLVVTGSTVNLQNVKIHNYYTAGIDDQGGSDFTISNSRIYDNLYYGILVGNTFSALSDSHYRVSNLTIQGNGQYGANNLRSYAIDLRNTYWGNSTGPFNAVSNPSGLGNKVSNNVLFNPWCASELSCEVLPPDNSNVLFIPGFEGSRLYKLGGILNPEDQLWEPNNNADVSDLSMDVSGASLDTGIYTRDIIDQANVILPTAKIYKSFMQSLDAMVADHTINAWRSAPYDWRFSPEYIVEHGILRNDSTISYTDVLPQGQLPYIISQLTVLSQNSRSGKVAIVTHSNGGLVVKALIRKLEIMQSPLLSKIDKIIMVAAPEVGTPKAIASLLHGYDTGFAYQIILKESTAREFGKNVPGAYGLLPSQKYFDTVTNPVVKFEPAIDAVNNFRTVYGDTITTFAGMKNFLLATLDGRAQPAISDTISPEVLNPTILNGATSVRNDLDNYQFPSNISLYHIAGWGQPTVSAIDYTTKQVCTITFTCSNVLDEKYNKVSDGDGTVVTPSATIEGGTKYYLNLQKYNSDTRKNYKHENIFEVSPLRDMVKNIIIGDTALAQDITVTKPNGADDLLLSVHSPVSIDMYDSAGAHTGLVTGSNPDFDQKEENIPNSSYLKFGDGKYADVPTGSIYTAKIAGLDFGTFTFMNEHYLNDTLVGTTSFPDVMTTPLMNAQATVSPSGVISQLKLDIDGDGIFETTILPNVSFDAISYLNILRQFVYSLHLPTTTEKSIIRKIDSAVSAINKSQITNATKKLKSLMQNVSMGKGHLKIITDPDKQQMATLINNLLDNLK